MGMEDSMRTWAIAVVMSLFVTACGPSPASAPAPPATQIAHDATSVPTQNSAWFAADGPGETALVYGVLGGAQELVLSCDMASKTFRAVAQGLDGTGWAKGDQITLQIGQASFNGEANQMGDIVTSYLSVELKITPDLANALIAGGAVKLAYQDQVQTAPADPQFVGFGETCKLWG